MKLKFEEKQYEMQMNLELACEKNLRKNVFAPGQVLEHELGIDVALFSCDRRFWKYLYRDWDYLFYSWYKYWRHGVDSRGILKLVKVFEDIIRNMPDIRYNLFIQYKRPKYLKKKTAAEYWKWKRPYFRYIITEAQQKLLENLSDRVEPYAQVIYAAPAFVTQDEFWRYVNEGGLIDRSNYCRAIDLKDHHRYTYIDSGTFGFAFSEPEEIKSYSIDEILKSLKKKNEGLKEGNRRHINRLSSDISVVMLESNSIYSKPYNIRLKFYESQELFNLLNEGSSGLYGNFVKIKVFEQITGINIFNGY